MLFPISHVPPQGQPGQAVENGGQEQQGLDSCPIGDGFQQATYQRPEEIRSQSLTREVCICEAANEYDSRKEHGKAKYRGSAEGFEPH